MSKLQDLIQKLCSDGVEYKKISECFDVYNGMTGVSLKWKETGNCKFIDYLNTYQNLKIDVSKKPFATVKNLNQNTVHQTDILLTTASEVPEECAISSVVEDEIEDNVFLDDHLFGLHLKEEYKELVNTTYINYYMKTPAFKRDVKKKVKGVTRFFVSPAGIASIEIPVPPLEVQEEIVHILDNFTNLAAELQAELQARQEQYEYYRNKLLSFNDINGGGYASVTWMKMSEIGTFTRGNGLQKKDFTESGTPCIHYGQIYTYYGTFTSETKSFVSHETAKKCKKAHKGDLIFATVSENIEDVCKCVAWLGNEEICISGDSLSFCHNQNPKYLAYYFQTTAFSTYKKTKVTGTKVIRLHQSKLEQFSIPIPPLAEQERIVSFLDRFDALTNDLSQGLPAEIAAVQEQYEYYRDKLLSFLRNEKLSA